MRTILTTLMASAVATLAFTAAHAADAIDQVPEAPMAYDQPAASTNWSGAYVGGAGSYNFGRVSGAGDYNNKAFGGSVYGGYNMQNGQIVYGGEADVGYSGNDGANGPARIKQGVNGSLRARVGYDASPFLLYGTAGVAAQNTTASVGAAEESDIGVGWTAGAGVETMVTESISARAEYRYTDIQKQNFGVGGGVSSNYNDHSIKLGVGVKF